MKDSKKDTKVTNFRPRASLNLIWKLLTGVMSDKTYDHLEENGLLPEERREQKEVQMGERSTSNT